MSASCQRKEVGLGVDPLPLEAVHVFQVFDLARAKVGRMKATHSSKLGRD